MTLLPCPFCGGDAEIVKGAYNFNDAMAECGCGVQGPMFDCDDGDRETQYERNRDEAVAAWNRRAEPPPGRCAEREGK